MPVMHIILTSSLTRPTDRYSSLLALAKKRKRKKKEIIIIIIEMSERKKEKKITKYGIIVIISLSRLFAF